MELVWTLAGFLLTLMVFSYVFGDNVLFRIATYIFVGVTAGYVAVMAVYQAILPRLVRPLLAGSWIEAVVPLVLGLLLIAKLFPRAANLGSVPMAYLVGVGAAVVIGGAVTGTLIGQTRAIIQPFNLQAAASPLSSLGEGILLLFGTVCTLAYFQFGVNARPGQPVRKNPIVAILGRIGEAFIAIVLGALFAGVFSASITALVERVDYLIGVIMSFR